MERVGKRSPDITFEFSKDLDAPRAARAALAALFDVPRPRSFTRTLADDVGLVASELVSNVVLHTDGGGQLHAWDDDPVRLEVHDHDPVLPAAAGKADERGGRGLRIVAGVADRWGARPAPSGKLVWAEFRRNLHAS